MCNAWCALRDARALQCLLHACGLQAMPDARPLQHSRLVPGWHTAAQWARSMLWLRHVHVHLLHMYLLCRLEEAEPGAGTHIGLLHSNLCGHVEMRRQVGEHFQGVHASLAPDGSTLNLLILLFHLRRRLLAFGRLAPSLRVCRAQALTSLAQCTRPPVNVVLDVDVASWKWGGTQSSTVVAAACTPCEFIAAAFLARCSSCRARRSALLISDAFFFLPG
jgi:hypothetical protein